MKHRDAQVTIIIGRNGTGKSTFCQKIIKALDERALVVTYNGMPVIWRRYPVLDVAKAKRVEKFQKGIRQVIAARYELGTNKNEVFKHIYTNFKGGIVVFDDCRGYIGGSVDNDTWFRQLILDFRHKMIDIFFVVHTPTDVPPRIWGFATTVFVGATDALVNKSQVKTHSADEVIQAQHEVNELYREAKEKGQNHYGIFKRIDL